MKSSSDTSRLLDFDFAQLVLVGSCAQGGHPNSGPLICTAGPCSCIYIYIYLFLAELLRWVLICPKYLCGFDFGIDFRWNCVEKLIHYSLIPDTSPYAAKSPCTFCIVWSGKLSLFDFLGEGWISLSKEARTSFILRVAITSCLESGTMIMLRSCSDACTIMYIVFSCLLQLPGLWNGQE